MTKKEIAAAAYLAGIIDGEGCIYFGRRADSKGMDVRALVVSNTDKSIIDFACESLRIIGVQFTLEHRIPKDHRKPFWTIGVRRGCDLARIKQIVPIASDAKRERLAAALESYRGVRCVGCRCLKDECTPGCNNCRKRHDFRRRYKAKKNRE